MTEHNEIKKRSVIGPDGQRLTRDDLPPANTKRWVIRRKAEVVASSSSGAGESTDMAFGGCEPRRSKNIVLISFDESFGGNGVWGISGETIN